MKRLIILALITGVVLGGYNCNRSTEKTSESLGIEESELAPDPMEQEIIKEGKEIENLRERDSGRNVEAEYPNL